MQKTSAHLSSAVKNKIWINKYVNLEFPYFFNTFMHILAKNSILFQYRVGTLLLPSTKRYLWFPFQVFLVEVERLAKVADDEKSPEQFFHVHRLKDRFAVALVHRASVRQAVCNRINMFLFKIDKGEKTLFTTSWTER